VAREFRAPFIGKVWEAHLFASLHGQNAPRIASMLRPRPSTVADLLGLHSILNQIGIGLLWAIADWVLAQALLRVPNLLLNGLSILRGRWRSQVGNGAVIAAGDLIGLSESRSFSFRKCLSIQFQDKSAST
jgi:hypothetical protein